MCVNVFLVSKPSEAMTVHRPGACRLFDVQVCPLDMMLVCRRDLHPVQPLMLGAKQGGTGYYFYSLYRQNALKD